MKKTILSVIFILIIVFCVIGSFCIKKTQEYTKDIYYMDMYINIKIYSSNQEKVNKALEEIDGIYSEYHKLSDRYNSYDNINNLYIILHNNSKDEYLEIEPKLYEMIEYGLYWYEKSYGKIDIRMGNVTDIWKNYRDVGVGIPSYEELNIANLNSIESIDIKEGNLIKNNHPNIDLGSIPEAYATEEVIKYLEGVNLDNYIINVGGNVKLGKHYNNSKYSIGLEDSAGNGQDIYKVVYGENISILTSGSSTTYYEYGGDKYNQIIDPETLYPPKKFKSVTVICDDYKLGIMLSNILYLLSVDDGQEYISYFDNVEAVWYTTDNQIIETSGFSNYEVN